MRLLSKWLVVALALIAVVRLVLVSSQTLVAAGGSLHDDELFLRLAGNLLAGDWLGPYNDRTLAKGPMYPLFVAANYTIGFPLLLTQHLLYLGAGLLLVLALSRLVRNGPILAAIFAVYAFNPAMVGGAAQRASRETFYSALTVLVVAGLIGLLAASREKRSRALPWGILLGLSFVAFWLTREEGVWLLPSAGLMMAAALWLLVRQARTERAWWRCGFIAVPVIVFLAGDAGVAAINQAKYGVFFTNEFREGPFPAAYGALSRVEHSDWKQYLPVPEAVREAIYRESPAFRELQPFLEGPLGQAWGTHGCKPYPQTCGDIAGGWFMWALRDAAAQAGHYATGEKAAAYWDRVAGEVNQACRDGRLICSGERSSMDPPPRWGYLTSLPTTLATAVTYLTGFAGVSPNQSPSYGAQISFPFFRAITRSPLAPAWTTESTAVVGWAYRPGTELSFQVEPGPGADSLGTVRQLPGPDIAAFFDDGSVKNSRFEVVCTQPCTVTFSTGAGVLGRLRLVNRAPIVSVEDDALKVHIDAVHYDVDAPVPAGAAIDFYKTRALAFILDGYKQAIPALFVLALLGYTITVGLFLVRRRASLVLIVNTALLGAVAARLLLLSWIHITSFPAINAVYLAPAYPLLLLFVGLALFDGTRQVWDAIAHHRTGASSQSLPESAPTDGAQAQRSGTRD